MHINKEFDVDILVSAFKKSWVWMLFVFLVFVAAAFIYLRYTKPIYESSTIIQLVSKDEGQKIVEIENINAGQDQLQEELELLKSELLLEKTLKSLNLSVGYFSKGKILTEEKYTNSSFIIQPLEISDSSIIGRPVWLTIDGDQIKMTYDGKNESFKEYVRNGELIESPSFKAYFKIVNEEQFRAESLENEIYFQFNKFDLLAKNHSGSLDVQVLNSDAKTIKIAYQSNNANLSRDLVAAHTNVFFQFDASSKQQSSTDILGFIDEQLDSVRNELTLSEDSLKIFKESNKESLAASDNKEIYDKSIELQNKIVSNNLDLQLLNEIQDAVSSNNNRVDVYNLMAGAIGTQFENALVKQLEDLHKLLLDREELSFGHTTNSSKMKIVQGRIKEQVNSIVNVIKAIKARIVLKNERLQSEKSKLDANFIRLPKQQMDLTRLERMYELNEKYYLLLLEKKTQYSISNAGFHSLNLILQKPVAATTPISPNRKMIYAAAIVFAIAVSLIILILRYLLFSEIQNPDELKKLLNPELSFLGVVPKYKKKMPNSQIVVHLAPKSGITESFRNVRTNIQFLNRKENGTIAISSSVSGEGKTFVALNLAGIIAMSGKKTILIDLDLRKPKVHLGFDDENLKGMSTILSGGSKLEDCIKKSELEGLHYISAGPIPPNPSELIINNKVQELIKELEKEYDQVIIDNPPIGLISDGLHIYNMVDIPIFIFRTNYSKRNFPTRINDLVKEGKIKNLSVILNGMTASKKGYGYGYGYGYGNYYQED